jgi:transposase
MPTYSQDLRDRVIRACDEGRYTREQIAQLFDVSTSWIRRMLKRRRETGSYEALPKGGPVAAKLHDEHRSRLVVLLREQPDATLAELHNRLDAAVHPTTIHRALAKLKITLKKKSSERPNRTAPMSATNGPSFAAAPPRSTPTASSSSTRPGPTPR